MKTRNINFKGIILTFLFSIFTSGLFAQRPYRPEHTQGANLEQGSSPAAITPGPLMPPPPPPPPPVADQPDSPLPPQLNLPDLTTEQLDKIRQAGLDHMKTMTPLRNQIREKKARLQTVLTTSPFDAKAADQVAEDLGKAETGILKEMIKHDQALRNLLTPAQQVLFDARPKPFLRRGK
jgi:hypothetical protein